LHIEEKNNVKYCVFENLENSGLVNHCFSTRIGGVSKGVYESLNISYTRGDKKENVDENLKRLSNAVGFNPKNIVCGKQIHKTHVLNVGKKDCGCDICGYDGYVTDEPCVVLCTFHADCVPLYFLDVKKKVIALSHAGWRGTAARMAEATVKKMTDTYGCNPQDIIVAIGPSIGKCCFQVDEPVVKEFRKNIDFTNDFIFNDENDKDRYKIDLWGVNKKLMEEAGIPEKNIEVTNLCTKCSPELFYSHRNMGNNRGSMAAYLMLKEF
jgi:YfiH family protein